MKSVKYVVMALVSLVSAGSMAQGVRVHGYLKKDSAAIGEIIPYILTASYPRDRQVVFPDSTYAFAPFEFQSRQYFPTRTAGDTSYDSAVYFLTTFEIDSVQPVRLPVFLIQARDSLAFYATADSLRLDFRVTMPLDSVSVQQLPLKANTIYQRVRWLFNYPFLIIGAVVLVIAILVAWLIFGKQIRKYFVLRRMRRAYRNFNQRFVSAVDTIGKEGTPRKAEDALVLWKRYMEELEQYPFTKSTSREILKRYSNNLLGTALRTIDRAIYGGYDASRDPFVYLQTYSREQFEKREAELRNG